MILYRKYNKQYKMNRFLNSTTKRKLSSHWLLHRPKLIHEIKKKRRVQKIELNLNSRNIVLQKFTQISHSRVTFLKKVTYKFHDPLRKTLRKKKKKIVTRSTFVPSFVSVRRDNFSRSRVIPNYSRDFSNIDWRLHFKTRAQIDVDERRLI